MPEVLAEELLRVARSMDEGGELPVTGNRVIDEAALKEAAATFLMTISPKERLKAKRLLYGFIESVQGRL